MDEYDLYGNVSATEPVFGGQTGRTVLRTHPATACSGEFCSIHNPSDHPLRDADWNWRADRGLLERICEHGVGHPDPDGIEHIRRTLGDESAWAAGVHGCCQGRCCAVS